MIEQRHHFLNDVIFIIKMTPEKKQLTTKVAKLDAGHKSAVPLVSQRQIDVRYKINCQRSKFSSKVTAKVFSFDRRYCAFELGKMQIVLESRPRDYGVFSHYPHKFHWAFEQSTT